MLRLHWIFLCLFKPPSLLVFINLFISPNLRCAREFSFFLSFFFCFVFGEVGGGSTLQMGSDYYLHPPPVSVAGKLVPQLLRVAAVGVAATTDAP